MITNYPNKLFQVARFKQGQIPMQCGCIYYPNLTGYPFWEKCEIHKDKSVIGTTGNAATINSKIEFQKI